MSDAEEMKMNEESGHQASTPAEQVQTDDAGTSAPEQTSPFDALTPNLIVDIFSFLDIPDLMNIQSVNHSWRELAQADAIWSSLYETTEFSTPSPPLPQDCSWYDRFRMHYESEVATIGGESPYEAEPEMDDMLSLPDPEALTVTELRQTLETEGFIMALQSGEDAVLTFLETPQTVLVMMDLLFDEPHQLEDIQSQRLVHITIQTLVSGIITDVFIMNSDLLDSLFDHLDSLNTEDTFAPTRTACMTKIVSALFEKFPSQMIAYFQSRETLIPSLLTYTTDINLMEILYKFVDCQLSHQWLYECDLMTRLVALLHHEEPFEIQESAAGVLAGVLSLCQTCPNSVLVNDVLNNEVVTGSIVAFIETRSNGESVKLGLRVLIGVLSLISDELEDPPTVVTLLSNSVGLFAGILADPADMDRNESFVTTTGPIARGFGFVRLGVLELLVSLLYTGFPIAVQCMLGERVFTIVLDLLFEYPWNNIIHNQISQLFSGLFCCNDPTIISSVIEATRLPERIVEAHQNIENVSVGYLGHLRELANELVRAGKMSEPIGDYLSTKPDWMAFVEEELAEFNVIECVVQDDYLEYENQGYYQDQYEEYEIVDPGDYPGQEYMESYDEAIEGEEDLEEFDMTQGAPLEEY